jgi:hypothetical protein
VRTGIFHSGRSIAATEAGFDSSISIPSLRASVTESSRRRAEGWRGRRSRSRCPRRASSYSWRTTLRIDTSRCTGVIMSSGPTKLCVTTAARRPSAIVEIFSPVAAVPLLDLTVLHSGRELQLDEVLQVSWRSVRRTWDSVVLGRVDHTLRPGWVSRPLHGCGKGTVHVCRGCARFHPSQITRYSMSAASSTSRPRPGPVGSWTSPLRIVNSGLPLLSTLIPGLHCS